VPLCDRAVTIIKEMAATRRSNQVFPQAQQAALWHRDDGAAAWHAAGRHRAWFRSSFRDWVGEETHFAHDTAEAALAHTRKDKHAANAAICTRNGASWWRRGRRIASPQALMTKGSPTADAQGS